MDIHNAFMQGAIKLALANREYTELHKSHGIDPVQWKLLTQNEYWTVDQAREIRSILGATVEVAMSIAGMPAIPLPGQYVAAVIATCVSPINRLVATMKAPDTFDAADASGLMKTSEVREMTKQQMIALVMYYSSGARGEPVSQQLPQEYEDSVLEMNTRERKKVTK